MTIELKSNENDKAVFTVEIQGEEFDNAVNKVYNESKGQFNIQGFRKGKAPRKIIEVNYGQTIFYEDALNEIMNEKYGEALEELELNPIDYPEVDVKGEISIEKPFEVEFTVQLMPTPKLKDYSDAEIDVIQMVATDEDLDQVLENEREKNSRLVSVEDRPAENGDTVNIDFEGFVDNVAFDGGKSENYDLVLGSNTFIPGFEDGLIGANTGDELDVNVTFPEEYQAENLAGKDAVFKVKVNNIKTKELPELDDDFAMDVSEFDTFEEYKENLKKQLEENVEISNKNEKYNRAIKCLIEYLEVEIPEVVIENQIDHELHDFEHRLAQMGMNLDTYYQITQSEEKAVREELRPQAIARVQSDFALQALAEAEGLTASEEEIDKELRNLAEQYKTEDVDKFVEDFKAEEDLGPIENFIITNKSLDKAVEVVKFNVVDKYEEHGVIDLPEEETEEAEESEEE